MNNLLGTELCRIAQSHRQLGMENIGIWWPTLTQQVGKTPAADKTNLIAQRRPAAFSLRAWDLVIRYCKNPSGAEKAAQVAMTRVKASTQTPSDQPVTPGVSTDNSKPPILTVNSYLELHSLMSRYPGKKWGGCSPRDFRGIFRAVAVTAYLLARSGVITGYQNKLTRIAFVGGGYAETEARCSGMSYLPYLVGFNGETRLILVDPEHETDEFESGYAWDRISGKVEAIQLKCAWNNIQSTLRNEDPAALVMLHPGFEQPVMPGARGNGIQDHIELSGWDLPIHGSSFGMTEAQQDWRRLRAYGYRHVVVENNPFAIPIPSEQWPDLIWAETAWWASRTPFAVGDKASRPSEQV